MAGPTTAAGKPGETTDDAPAPLSPEEQEAYAQRDLRSVGWFWLELLRLSGDPAKHGSAAASIMRLIYGFGEEAKDLAEASEVAIVNGMLVNGFAPRNEREWEIARRIFEPSTLEMLGTWETYEGALAG